MASDGAPPDAERIRQLRRRRGLTQVRLAELLGVSFASVNRWENRQSQPTPLAWRALVQLEQEAGPAKGGAPGSEHRLAEAPAAYALDAPPTIDFRADPTLLRLVVEGERLTYGYLFNPTFASELSLVDPLPHQRIAVYEEMLGQPRLRFLLADDPGAGKTIMTGLYVREMLARRLIERVLIVPPAGLVGNWERELRLLFGLPFSIAGGAEARSGNPFTGPPSDLTIMSVDTLAGDRAFARLQEPSVRPYDLVVFDEAHKLAADREPDLRLHKTERYRLAEALAGVPDCEPERQLNWSAQHLLLLTATPHMGKDFPYYALWRLLEPEVLSTVDAFNAYPPEARRWHFLRRTKEEMVYYDGAPIFPTRTSDTLSYELSRAEQELYDETTRYLRTFYNRARILNRSAARLAMSVFQRRLASSTYALLRSFDRRLLRLDALIEAVRSGQIDEDELNARQQRLDARATDRFDESTAEEEAAERSREQNEVDEEELLGGVVARTLGELEAERIQVETLRDLARRVHDAGDESKFDRLRELLRDDPQIAAERVILFTEHRDTLDFLVRRLEGLGFTGRVARIHGGMDYRERDEQVAFFRREGEVGARFLVATDAAGEGINLQFCWLMVNYDIPWNPARLEQRMGRIHRYGQRHNPVVIVNLVAGKTREGRVLRTLLVKLERIRRELRSDKVFDVVGKLFEGISLRDYMASALDEAGAVEATSRIEGTLTREQVEALRDRERRRDGDGGDVRARLPALRAALEREPFLRLLPGYVRRFVEQAAPRLDLGLDGDLDGTFSLVPRHLAALDPLLPELETYPPERRDRLTVRRPVAGAEVVFLRPGEPFFDRLRAYVCDRFAPAARRGAVFVDPTATRQYFFHVAAVAVERAADPAIPALAVPEVLECRLVGIRQDEGGEVEQCAVEQLLLLTGAQAPPPGSTRFAAEVDASRELAGRFAVEHVAARAAETRRGALLASLPERERLVVQGYGYQEAELAATRARLSERARNGDAPAIRELGRVKERQRALAGRRDQTRATLRREPELIVPGEVTFLAHALVVPSADPQDRLRHDAAVEEAAVRVACLYEQAQQAVVRDVSTPERARAAGLGERPGFDLLSRRPDGQELAIEVKGRAGIGDVELTENEWVKACNLGDRYFLYVVYECAGASPHLLRVRNPFGKLVVRAKGGVLIDEREIYGAAEVDGEAG